LLTILEILLSVIPVKMQLQNISGAVTDKNSNQKSEMKKSGQTLLSMKEMLRVSEL
jgi:hypothetical protein